jgi:hypothetical protein
VFRLRIVLSLIDHRAADIPSACEIHSSVNWEIYDHRYESEGGGDSGEIVLRTLGRIRRTIACD